MWEYEQEVRLVMLSPSPAYAAFTAAQADHPKEEWDWREIHHYMPLKGECFESIYFSVSIEKENVEKNGGDCYSKTEQTVTVLMAQN